MFRKLYIRTLIPLALAFSLSQSAQAKPFQNSSYLKDRAEVLLARNDTAKLMHKKSKKQEQQEKVKKAVEALDRFARHFDQDARNEYLTLISEISKDERLLQQFEKVVKEHRNANKFYSSAKLHSPEEICRAIEDIYTQMLVDAENEFKKSHSKPIYYEAAVKYFLTEYLPVRPSGFVESGFLIPHFSML